MKYDLLLTGGEVVDPAAGLRGVMDIGIAGGKIVAVGPSLAAAEARRTIGAKGRLVTPGLVDIHAHIFVNAHDMAGDTDRFCRASGVTTLCDAGSTGSATFAGLRQVIDREVRTHFVARIGSRAKSAARTRCIAQIKATAVALFPRTCILHRLPLLLDQGQPS